MRITTKGQVTIPAALRERAGLLPNTEVEFAYEGRGRVVLSRASKKKSSKSQSRGEKLIAQMLRHARAHPLRMTTDEIMALTRGDD